MRRAAILALVVAACGGGDGAGPDAAVAETHALDMTDVSILVPLPAAVDAPPVIAGAPGHIPADAYDEIVVAFNDIASIDHAAFTEADFQLVALRFDVCQRPVAGPCPPGMDGRLRLIFQPIYTYAGQVATIDVALHAFYPIPADEVAGVVGDLRALARIADSPAGAPLAVSPPLVAGNAEYRTRLTALVARYCDEGKLVRLTTIGQMRGAGSTEWVMRGVDRAPDGSNALIAIPNVVVYDQVVQAAGGGIRISPIADEPVRFSLAINAGSFAKALPHDMLVAFAALQDVQNPLLHDSGDTQCAGCHVANAASWIAAGILGGNDPSDIAGGYTNPRHDLTVTSVANTDNRVIRIFGYSLSTPVIARRVANDTAEVLDDIDARFPAPGQ